MKVVAIIQARMGSTRLPGKVMKTLKGSTILSHVVSRVKQSQTIDEIVVATTDRKQDEEIVKEALLNQVEVFQGDEKNVLERFYLATMKSQADVIVRITSDCPLIDPHVIDKLVTFYKENNNYSLVTNAGADLKFRTYPRGLDVEVFSVQALEVAYDNALLDYQKEHVTPYLYENEEGIYYYTSAPDYSNYRLTLDTIDDWKLVEEIYDELYHGTHNFYLNEIVELLQKNPLLSKINQHVIQKER